MGGEGAWQGRASPRVGSDTFPTRCLFTPFGTKDLVLGYFFIIFNLFLVFYVSWLSFGLLIFSLYVCV